MCKRFVPEVKGILKQEEVMVRGAGTVRILVADCQHNRVRKRERRETT